MRIRSARPAEAAALGDLAFVAKSVWPYDRDALARYRDQLAVHAEDIEGGRVFIAEEMGEVVGVYILSPASDPGRLYFMFVALGRQRRGYGRALWADALSRAKSFGWSKLSFFADDHACAAFYDRMGCRRLRVVPNELSGTTNEIEFVLT